MRREFYDIYRDLYETYRITQTVVGLGAVPSRVLRAFPKRVFPPYVRDLRIVEDAIADVLAEMNLTKRTRPDARLFLLVNLHQMIALPLEYSPTHEDFESLDDSIRQDLRTILHVATEEKKQDEITGHDVINAIQKVWETLRTTKLEVWG